jgi:hypothetical protein
MQSVHRSACVDTSAQEKVGHNAGAHERCADCAEYQQEAASNPRAKMAAGQRMTEGTQRRKQLLRHMQTAAPEEPSSN